MTLKMFLLTILCCLSMVLADNNGPVVDTCYGALRGVWRNSTKGRVYASFQGIPYAAPPVGMLRFREPQPVPQWSGERDASKVSDVCLQYDGWWKRQEGVEDCLYLNVYSPNLNPETPLPVLIYIHGGAFLYGGGGKYGPQNLMDWDIIVVTLNYRLGALGFLSTGDEVVPGNNGLKDQSFALHWVKDNIHNFGGDPNAVTLTGNSAGGASVHYHYLSHKSRGTFAKGVTFSGSAFCPWTHAMKPVMYGKWLGANAGCPTECSQDMIDCLRKAPGDEIIRAQMEIYNFQNWPVHMFGPFTPTKEPETATSFLTKYPYEATLSGDVYNVPLVATVMDKEGLYPGGMLMNAKYADAWDLLGREWDKFASYILEYNDTLPLDMRPSVATKIKKHYFDGKDVSKETFPQLVQAFGDRLFNADIARWVLEHAHRTGQPTYMYHFKFRGERSLSNKMSENMENYGVSHGDDVIHIFRGDFPMSQPDDIKITEILIEILYNYATTGIPKPSGVEWLPVNPVSSKLDYLEILSPNQLEMKSSGDFGNMTFWDSLGFYENVHYNESIRG
ncbi:hypothetical protein ACJJTC_013248 [Scirpophaga incertulas]